MDCYDAEADGLGFVLGSLVFEAEGDGAAEDEGAGVAEGEGSDVADEDCLKLPKIDGSVLGLTTKKVVTRAPSSTETLTHVM